MIRARYRNRRRNGKADRMRRWGHFSFVYLMGILLGGLVTFALCWVFGDNLLIAFIPILVLCACCWLLTRRDLDFVSNENGVRSLLLYFSCALVFMSSMRLGSVLQDNMVGWHAVNRLTAHNFMANKLLEVHNLELDTTNTGSYIDKTIKSDRYTRSLSFHGIIVFPVKGLKNAFVWKDVYSSCNYDFASDKSIESAYKVVRKRLQAAKASTPSRSHCFIRRYTQHNKDSYWQKVRAAMETTKGRDAVNEGELVFFHIESNDGVPTWKHLRYEALAYILWALIMAAVFYFTKEHKRDRYLRRTLWTIHSLGETWKSATQYLLHYFPVVALCAIFVFMYFLEVSMGFSESRPDGEILCRLGAFERDKVFGEGQWWRLISYAFLHGSFWHLTENVMGLLFVSSIMDEEVKPNLQCAIFLLASLFCGFVYLAFSDSIIVGASNGIFAMMGACLSLAVYRAYKNREYCLSILVLGVFCVCSLLYSFARGVSMLGHVTGLMCGIVMGLFLMGRRK